MYGKMKQHLRAELDSLGEAGLYKRERVIVSPQRAAIGVAGGKEVINFCANNYLGLSDHPRLIEAAKRAMDSRGYGMSSVRFICGTQDIHKQLEGAIADYFGTEDTILYAACFDANGGVRAAARREGRDHLRCAEPCVDHRRSPAVQGRALPLCERRYGRAGALPEAGSGPAVPGNRYRRSLLDGRQCRSDGPHLRAGRALRRAGHGRRVPLGGRRRAYGPGSNRAVRSPGPGRYHYRHARQGVRRRDRRIHDRPPGDRRDAAPAFAAVPFLELVAAGWRRGGGRGGSARPTRATRCTTA